MGFVVKALALLCIFVAMNAVRAAPRARPYYWWSHWHSHYYHYCPTAMNWNDAQNYCKSHGGNLATPMNYHQQAMMYWLQAHNPYVYSLWIGVNDLRREGHYVSPRNTYVPYHHWYHGQPSNYNNNEDCVEMYRSNGLWNDRSCCTKLPFICELPRHHWGKKK